MHKKNYAVIILSNTIVLDFVHVLPGLNLTLRSSGRALCTSMFNIEEAAFGPHILCVFHMSLTINGEYVLTKHTAFGIYKRNKNYTLIHSLCEFQAINGEESLILGN
jgi:hypothetical protein